MKKLAHISDLHFGTEDPLVAEGLLNDLEQLAPDLIVISGDVTQRGRGSQFKAARRFLDKLKSPYIVVPGNHDIPLFDLFRRFFAPLKRFKNYISDDMFPLYADREIAVLGINTARSLTWKNGRISMDQINGIKKIMCPVSPDIFKVLVTHHPFIPPPGEPGIALVGRSAKALNVIDECQIDLLLAGHLHHGYSGDIRPYYPTRTHSVISAQAGTAVSRRIRNEPNAFNMIYLERSNIKIQIRIWKDRSFSGSLTTSYKLKNKEWIKEK